ncbi:MAG: 30S ribosomal protein S12 methylthiotransferase RimO [candidate division KSB1 bacterium]|nr:30S ribosomal protein S12 methylthiotransferase RimO [candidate division KSB1 bacterium]
MSLKIYLETLGCPKNQVDAEKLLGHLLGSGVRVVGRPEQADVLIVNTCAFIEPAREESIETILEMAALKSGGTRRLFVTGCLPQRFREGLRESLPEVDAFFSDLDPVRVADQVREILGLSAGCPERRKRYLLNSPHFAYLKLAEGCDNRCAYCSIPLIKGSYRSRSRDEIVQEARELAARGVRELNLVAQDTTYYGRDREERGALASLLEELAGIEGIEWIRLLYTHPAHLDEDVVAQIARLPKLCRYVDLPVQHASDRILQRMGRRTDQRRLRELVERLRGEVEGIVLRTTVLVGFPGETEEDFEQLLEFLTWARFERVGVFGYSREPGTRAARMRDQIPPEVVAMRVDTVSDLAQTLAQEWYESQVGRRLKVLIDDFDRETGEWVGRTEWDAPEIDGVVRVTGQARRGAFVECEIRDAAPFELMGVVTERYSVGAK